MGYLLSIGISNSTQGKELMTVDDNYMNFLEEMATHKDQSESKLKT